MTATNKPPRAQRLERAAHRAPHLENKLSFRSSTLNVELSGQADQVQAAYRALRAQLLEQIRTATSEDFGLTEPTRPLPVLSEMASAGWVNRAASARREKDAAHPLPAPEPETNYIHLVVCERTYNKMYLLDEARFTRGFLGKVLSMDALRRIYVDAAVEKQVRTGLEIGSTLWRELTAAGRAAIDGNEG